MAFGLEKSKMNRGQAGAVFDRFTPEQQNMPREEFIRQVVGLTDQNNIQTDLMEIQMQKARRRSIQINNTRKINRAVN